MTNAWRVVMHPSCERNWNVLSPITLLVAEFLMKTSLFWTKVYAKSIFLLELMWCEHSESIIHLSLSLTNLFVMHRMLHLSSSSPISSVTLAFGCFFFWSNNQLYCALLVTIVACQILVFWVTHGASIITPPLNNELARNHNDETHPSIGCQFCPFWANATWSHWPWLLTCLQRW